MLQSPTEQRTQEPGLLPGLPPGRPRRDATRPAGGNPCAVPVRRALCAALSVLVLLSGCGGSWRDKLSEGDRMMERQEYAEAAALFGKLAGDGHIEGTLRRGDAYAALAQAQGSGGEAQAVYYANALADYRAAASELGGETAADVLPRLTALYLAMGGTALELGDYDGAEGYFYAVLDWNHANPEAYGRLAEVSMARGRLTEAAARLEKGVTATHNAGLKKRLEELRAMADEKEAEKRRLAAAQALKDVPYFGDVSACAMGPEQALAYARLMADGIGGRFQGFTGYGRPLYNGNVYWDEPYAVLGMGSYETDRALAVLGDFAGDGNPYLYVFSSVVDGRSFEVFGWKDGEVVRAAGVEAWGSQREGRLAVTAKGTVVLEESEPTGERSRSGRTVRFGGGGAGVAGLQDETWDPSEEAVRVTTNGVPSTYSEEEWRNREGLSTGPLDAVTAKAFPLRQMIAALNGYAAALGGASSGGASGGGTSNGNASGGGTDGATLEPVEIPPEHSPRHRRAAAMLRKLFALNRLSVEEEGARLCDTRLLDLDRDGQEELFVAFQGTYQSEANVPCQYALYRWTEEGLNEYPGADGLDELHLAQYENEYGILGAGRDPDLPLSQSLTEQDASDPSAGRSSGETSGNTNGSSANTNANTNANNAAGGAAGNAETSGNNNANNHANNNGENAGNSGENRASQTPPEAAAPEPEPVAPAQSRAAEKPYTLRYAYTFLSHSEEIVMDADGEKRAYHVVRSGRQADIAAPEFASIRDRYTVLQTLMNYRTSDLQNRNYNAVISALYRMQAEG